MTRPSHLYNLNVGDSFERMGLRFTRVDRLDVPCEYNYGDYIVKVEQGKNTVGYLDLNPHSHGVAKIIADTLFKRLTQ